MRKLALLVLVLSIFSFSQIAAQTHNHAEDIEGPFDSPQEVTETCLACHDDVGSDFMHTRHWNWIGESENSLGKKNMINNYCISIQSNWPRCTSCHAGYGWKDSTFDFTNENNIDCLICHDQTGTYKKIPTGAGMPDTSVDLVKVAQSVGRPTRHNCGICHFDGGGGSGVKHGDMDDSMYDPGPELDVHMGKLDFQCTVCHETEKHKISGAGQGSMAEGVNHFSCEDCHDADPHDKAILNKHTKTIACETCHIPEFAREEPTKMWWDWSKAGEDRTPKIDKYGKPDYHKKKGEFIWEANVIPDYEWYDGKTDYYRMGEKLDPNEPLVFNKLEGSITDPNSKITPFKAMRGKQPFDPVNNYLIIPHLFGKDGYWKTFDWKQASEIGMKAAGLKFSGEVGFIETKMYWPINHMVALADDALKCTECHGVTGKKRLDWKKLGYKEDPMKSGGRFKNHIVEE
ncbi:MAG: tetrathionate reductase family octaheme c-type cytochrome [Chlorobi bacterium]|nr:tetrathionate reductase family octaheme c-type cytochrome [Chlorobiota bacterium]